MAKFQLENQNGELDLFLSLSALSKFNNVHKTDGKFKFHMIIISDMRSLPITVAVNSSRRKSERERFARDGCRDVLYIVF